MILFIMIIFFVSKTMYSGHEKCKWHRGTKAQKYLRSRFSPKNLGLISTISVVSATDMLPTDT